ncbi:nitrite reductase small subunit NirD [Streptomyces sp. BH-SS-21]|uniref:Nitrite reductase small subunit NirD n=1 Tax=Streptomyces liliiviolaceus TaxID=2823109 RepID=A0A940XUJ1_9ACTN|nr:nitrite reductase small subunit NirD [Streptomyces liliiviolaceus]MBQ0849198.1 nitrite reductase small subunit NirD [Streptomyces liliiviolaceus]
MTLAPETTTLTVQLRLAGPPASGSGSDDWFAVCDLSVLIPGRGVAALLPDGRQVALFLDRTGRMYAIDNRDPFSGAAVLSRGLTGSHRGRPFVASPLLKQRFDLTTGACLDDESVRVTTYEVRAR